jgi:hypothetical protein
MEWSVTRPWSTFHKTVEITGKGENQRCARDRDFAIYLGAACAYSAGAAALKGSQIQLQSATVGSLSGRISKP